MENITRRALVCAIPSLAAVATIPVCAGVTIASEHPDAELIRLGSELESELATLGPLCVEQHRLWLIWIEEGEEKFGKQGDWKRHWSLESYAPYKKARGPVGDGIDRLEALLERIERIVPQTTAGFAVLMRAASLDCVDLDVPSDIADFVESPPRTWTLARDLEAMARVGA